MSFQTLWIGVSGLTAAQRAMEVTANNVANVNTEGYSRQRVELVNGRPVPGTYGSRGDGMKGTGVTVADVVRARSSLADNAFRSETSTQASWSARSDLMGRAEQVLGPIGGGTPKALADFFGSWEELSLHPEMPAARRSVLEAGATLAGSFNSAANDLAELQAGAADQVRTNVDEVNRLAAQVAKLNAGIADATNGQQSPNDLLDQRDRIVDQLSALTGATVRQGELGRVDVFVGSRALVRGETVETLKASTADPITVTWTLGGEAAAPGGTLGGLVGSAATVAGLRQNLDNLANSFMKQVNDAHGAGYDLTTVPAPPTGQTGNLGAPFFKGTGAAQMAMNITDPSQVAAAASPTGGANDGNNALALADLRTLPMPTGQSGEDTLHAFAAQLGSLASEATDQTTASSEVLAGLAKDRASVSSVSTDEEMADMVRFQRAYEASARLMTTVDQMLDRLINSTGMVGR
jgi:flagellar hook-associated protein 1 FlgK